MIEELLSILAKAAARGVEALAAGASIDDALAAAAEKIADERAAKKFAEFSEH